MIAVSGQRGGAVVRDAVGGSLHGLVGVGFSGRIGGSNGIEHVPPGGIAGPIGTGLV